MYFPADVVTEQSVNMVKNRYFSTYLHSWIGNFLVFYMSDFLRMYIGFFIETK